MTRWSTFLFSILCCVSNSVFSYPYWFAHRVFVPNTPPAINFLVEAWNAKPQTSQLDYAILFNELVDRPGVISSIHPDNEWGYHINFGVAYYLSGDINFHFRGLDTHDHDHVTNRNELLMSTLVELMSVTSVINVADAFEPDFTYFDARTSFITTTAVFNLASAETKTKFRNLDIELGRSLNIGTRMNFRFFEGARAINLHQSLLAIYTGANAGEEIQRSYLNFDTGTFLLTDIVPILNIERAVHEKSNVEGIGPRVGLDTNFIIYPGLNLTTHIATALLVSHFRSAFQDEAISNYTATITPVDIGPGIPDPVTIANSTSSVLNQLKSKSFRTIPNWDFRLGLKLTLIDFYKHEYSVEAGYLVDYYYNVVDRYRELETQKPPTVEVLDTSFKGPFLNVQIKV